MKALVKRKTKKIGGNCVIDLSLESLRDAIKHNNMVAGLDIGLDVSQITHRFPTDDFQLAFDIMEKDNCKKVVLNWE